MAGERAVFSPMFNFCLTGSPAAVIGNESKN